MSMKTAIVGRARAKITVPLKWVDGTIYTKSKICVTAKSAALFYASAKGLNHAEGIRHSTRVAYWQQTPAQHAHDEARYDRLYRRVLPVFKQYLP